MYRRSLPLAEKPGRGGGPEVAVDRREVHYHRPSAAHLGTLVRCAAHLALLSLVAWTSSRRYYVNAVRDGDGRGAPHENVAAGGYDGRPPGALFDPIPVPRKCSADETRRRIIDVTLINNELSSLELRLNELWDVVDHFFVAESTIPFKPDAKPKPLHLKAHWDDFAKFHSKITLYEIPPEIS